LSLASMYNTIQTVDELLPGCTGHPCPYWLYAQNRQLIEVIP
jgi:hypothetical protein